MKEVKNIMVLGAGAMGAQIAALAVEAGYILKSGKLNQNTLTAAAN
jgi:3-hydroxyacyl-CoA dehydrogenase